MDTVVRRAVTEDAECLGELHSEAFAALYSDLLAPEVLAQLSPPAMGELWRRFTSRGGEYVQFVAEHDGGIVGFVGVGPGRDEGFDEATELYFIAVAQGATRSGAGRALLDAVADTDYLWIAERNRAAQAFYKRAGFRLDSKRRIGSIFGTDIAEIRMSR